MSPQAQGHLAMLLFSAVVAGSFSLGSLAANDIAPMALTAARFAIGTAVVCAVTLATSGIPRFALAAPWRYPIMGALMAIYFVLMFEGLKTAPPVSMAAVFTLTPAMAAVLGWILLRQRPTGRLTVALAIGGMGALWVIFRADWSAFLAFGVGRGEALFFWGCVGHALYPIAVRTLNRGESPLVFTLGMLASGTILLWLTGWTAVRETDWLHLPPVVWITLGYISVFSTALSFFLVQYASLRLPPAKVMAYTYLTPSWVIAWEIALRHPLPPMLVLVGITATVLALLMLLKDDTPTPEPAQP